MTIDEIDGSPTQAIPAGANRVAIRTSGSGLYLVDLDAKLLTGTIALGTNGSATLTFDTLPGDRYQVERSDSLGTAAWVAVGATFAADGITHTENISIDQAKASFFRLARVL